MKEDDPIYTTLENARLQSFLLLPPLFYEDQFLSKAIVVVAKHTEKMAISDQVIHQVTRLPNNAPTVPKGAKMTQEQATQEYSKSPEDDSTSSVRIKGLKEEKGHQVAKSMVLNHIRLCLHKMLAMVRNTTNQASFFMPSIFSAILLHLLPHDKLPIPQSMSSLPTLHALCNVYGRGVIASVLVTAWIEKMQLIVEWLETEGGEAPIEVSKKSTTGLFHGQETHPRSEREAEEVKKRKGKEVAEEQATPSTA
eukprot:Gb_22005 [translate_table: standard]